MKTQSRNNRFVSECLRCAFAEQDAAPAVPRMINQPLATQSGIESHTNQATVVDRMLQRFAQFGVTVPQASFFGRPVGEVIATMKPHTPPTAPAAVKPTKTQRAFVMPPRSTLPRAA